MNSDLSRSFCPSVEVFESESINLPFIFLNRFKFLFFFVRSRTEGGTGLIRNLSIMGVSRERNLLLKHS